MFLHACLFRSIRNKNYIITNVCLLLFELGKVSYGHPCILRRESLMLLAQFSITTKVRALCI